MAVQVVGCGRFAVASQVFRRGAGHEAQIAKLARDQARVGGLAYMDRGVDAFVGHVHGPVAEFDVEHQIGVLVEKGGYGGDDDAPSETDRHMQAQAPVCRRRRLAEHVLRMLDVHEYLLAVLEKALAVVGQAGGARGALQ